MAVFCSPWVRSGKEFAGKRCRAEDGHWYLGPGVLCTESLTGLSSGLLQQKTVALLTCPQQLLSGHFDPLEVRVADAPYLFFGKEQSRLLAQYIQGPLSQRLFPLVPCPDKNVTQADF